MQKKLFRQKQFIVDNQRYEASLTAKYADVIQLRMTIRADFGNRSFCTFSGLQNFDYYHNYGHWDDIDSIAVTPRLICALIRYARRNGWEPDTSKSNRQIDLSNPDVRFLLDEYNAGIGTAAESTLSGDATQIATNKPMPPSGGTAAPAGSSSKPLLRTADWT